MSKSNLRMIPLCWICQWQSNRWANQFAINSSGAIVSLRVALFVDTFRVSSELMDTIISSSALNAIDHRHKHDLANSNETIKTELIQRVIVNSNARHLGQNSNITASFEVCSIKNVLRRPARPRSEHTQTCTFGSSALFFSLSLFLFWRCHFCRLDIREQRQYYTIMYTNFHNPACFNSIINIILCHYHKHCPEVAVCRHRHRARSDERGGSVKAQHRQRRAY